MARLIEKFLPEDCYDQHKSFEPEGIVLHHMSAKYANSIGLDNSDPYGVDVCRDILIHYGYSAHFLIDYYTGDWIQLVPLDKIAWHAGISLMNGRANCNAWCLGVELISTGKPSIDGTPAYPDTQFFSLIELTGYLFNKIPSLRRVNIDTHRNIRANAINAGMRYSDGRVPKPKHDPSSNFPWGQYIQAIQYSPLRG